MESRTQRIETMFLQLSKIFTKMPRIKMIQFARVYSGISGLSTNIIMDYLFVLSANQRIYSDCRNYMYPDKATSDKMIKQREDTWAYFQQSGRNDD
jgi:hypothetical protein